MKGLYWIWSKIEQAISRKCYRLDKGDVNLEKTPQLHMAVGNPETLRALIVKGVDLEQRDEDGATALFIAVMNKEIKSARILLDAGADPNAIADEPAATILAPTPLNLAHQARFFMNDEEYQYLINLLQAYGAVDEYWQRE